MAKKKSPALRSVGDALTNPQTRQERYLANIAGLVATKPEYPFTRLERYLDAIAQSTGGSAEAIEELKQTKLNVYGGGVNLLDNWYFVGGGSQQGGGQFPINQKGHTNYIGSSAGSVSVDRWSSYLNVAISESYITLSHGVGSSFVQYLNTREVKGKQCTLSFLTGDNALYSGAFSFPDNFPVSGGIVTYFELRISTGTFLRASYAPGKGFPDCRIVVLDGGTPITVKAIKLELGDTQTLAHQDAGGNWILNDPPPNFQQELAKCQRYLLVLKPTTGNALVAHGFGQDSTHYRFSVPTPVSMLPPTSVTMTGQVQILANGSYKDVYDLSVLWGSNGNSVNIAASLQEASSAFELYGYAMLAVIGSSSSIIISAEP